MDFRIVSQYKRGMTGRLRRSPTIRQGLALLLAAILVVGLGFGSAVRASATADGRAQAVELANYALPDGTLPVICRGGLAGDDDAPGHASQLHCFVCAFAKIAGLPPMSGKAPVIAAPLTKPRLVHQKAAPAFSPSKAFFARGPPIRI
ncbi:hypothetical protein B7H23_03155 [Notoacmeibacter marinus]|uniref:DUF2946 domain-containing protein n=1 Tax=Notoacmeibacter marinus TaxID=1876515 RepID=A0A231V189_9HYPH|nr:hypothetical protein [Notoacmeibacter marinus]OXT01953.1 hypothetical protein B7H23_03155 [Notoacmeibacter marinus]